MVLFNLVPQKQLDKHSGFGKLIYTSDLRNSKYKFFHEYGCIIILILIIIDLVEEFTNHFFSGDIEIFYLVSEIIFLFVILFIYNKIFNELEIFNNGILVSTNAFKRITKKQGLIFIKWDEIKVIKPEYTILHLSNNKKNFKLKSLIITKNNEQKYFGHVFPSKIKVKYLEKRRMILKILKEKLHERWKEVFVEDTKYLLENRTELGN